MINRFRQTVDSASPTRTTLHYGACSIVADCGRIEQIGAPHERMNVEFLTYGALNASF